MSVAGIIVGSVGVQVYPDVSRFWQEFKAKTKAGAEQAGQDLSRDLSATVASRLSREVTRGLQTTTAAAQGRKAGADFGDAFSRQMASRIEAAAKALGPRIKVDADTAPAIAEMEWLRKKIRETEAHLRIGRIDDATAVAQINAIQTRLAQLGATDPNIRVQVNASTAAAQLAGLQAQTTALGSSVANIGVQSQGSTSRLMRMLRAAALLAPALVPVGAVAVPALIALGSAGGVAALAFIGLKENVDQAASAAVKGEFTALKDDLMELSGVAAGGSAFGLVQGMQQIRELTPGLRDDVSLISAQLAEITGNTGVGLIRILEAAAPLTDRMLDGVLGFSRGFADFGGSPEFRRFLEFAAAKIPEVKAALSEMGTAIGHIIEASAPWGSLVLGAFTAVSSAISAIPMPILTQLVTMLELLLAKAVLAKVFGGIATSAYAMAASFAAARAAGAGLGVALAASLGPAILAAAALAGAAYGLTHMTVQLVDVKAKYGDLTAAIRADNLALGQNTKEALAASTQTNGLADAARSAGMSTADLVNGITGSDQAFKDLMVNLDGAGVLTSDLTTELIETRTGFERDLVAAKDLDNFYKSMPPAIRTLKDEYGDLSTELGIGAEHVKDYAEQLGFTDTTAARYSGVVKQLAVQYTVANSAQSKLMDATLAYASSAGTAADQASYLGSVLVASQGDALGVAGAFASAYGAATDFATAVKDDAVLQQGLRDMADKLSGVNLATADMATYSDIFSSASAPAITQALSGIQAQGEGAAKAWYEHQVGIVGTKEASEQASELFRTTTHDALVGMAGDLGLTQEQAGALADNLLKSDGIDPEFSIIANGLETANQTLQTMVVTLANLNGEKFTSYYEVITNFTEGEKLFQEQRASVLPSANGNIFGSVGSYADGAHVAQIAQPTYRMWAEPETGGEAYIPMALQKRARSTAILNTVADRFGLALSKKAGSYSTGAVIGRPGIATGGGGVNVGTVAITEAVDPSATATSLIRRLEMLGV